MKYVIENTAAVAQGSGFIILLLVAVIIAVIIGFLVYFFRDSIFGEKKSKTVVDQDIERYLDQIRQLARSHKYRDAALLVYQTLTILVL